MNTKYAEYTQDRINALRRIKNRARGLGLALMLASAALGLLLLLAAIDYCLVLSSGVRACCLLVAVVLLALGSGRVYRLLRRAATSKDIALELEQRRPELGCVLSTAVEYLPGGRTANAVYEPQLVAALQEQAARRLVLIETPWWRRQLIRRGYFAAGIGVLLGLFAAMLPGGSIALRRALFPWNQAAYTTIQVRPGNLEVPEGTDQEIEARISGKLLRGARLEWQMRNASPWQFALMHRLDSRRFVAPLLGIQGEVIYRVSGAGSASPLFKLTSFVPPQLKQMRVRITPPAYTKEASREECGPDLTVLRASQLDFALSTVGSVTNASLRFADQPLLQLLPSGEASEWSNSLAATRSSYYWLELLDKKGRKGTNDRPFKLTVLPDEKPVVDIIEPGLDIRAEPGAKVSLRISATDDYGIRDLRLVFRKMNGSWHTNSVKLPKVEPKELEAPAQLDLAPLGLQEYEVAAYYAEAVDNNTLDGPGVGRSPVYFIEYTTKEKPLGQCRGNSTKINLLELEKQIIAATTALAESGEESKYRDLASMQRQTKSYASIFASGFLLAISPPQARVEFDAALKAMDQASTNLDDLARSAALTHEEAALRHLYETCRLLPELEEGMCRGQGNCIKVVLDAIEKLKEERKRERREALPLAIQQGRRLLQLQKRLQEILAQRQDPTNKPAADNAGSGRGETGSRSKRQQAHTNLLAMESRADGPDRSGQSADKGQTDSPSAANTGGSGTNNQSEGTGTAMKLHPIPAARTGSGPSLSQATKSESEGGERRDGLPNTKDDGSGQALTELTNTGLSEEQRKLAESAASLSEKLQELSGKDPRISFRYSGMVKQTSEYWSQASGAVANSDCLAAGQYGALGISMLGKVVSALEVIYGQTSPAGDFAAEEYPKEFEAQINDYLKRLSYAD
jgi:hypothetical protein